MLVNVIKTFPYSEDPRGLEIRHAELGEREIPDSIVAGLVSEGYIEQPEDMEPVPFATQRRKLIVDRVVGLFRAHLETVCDDELLHIERSAERQAADEAERKAHQASEADDRAEAEFNLEGLAGLGEMDLSAAELFDVMYRNPTSGEQLADKGLTREDADARAKALAEMDEPAADIQIVAHVEQAADDDGGYIVPPAVETVAIPDGWQSLHHKTRGALAKKLGWVDGEPTAEQANGWIADILVHRERAAPREDLGGLSLQEVHATLTAAGVEWDADTSPADLLALYELAKAEKAGA
jgi:hypothetical protein